MHGISAMHVSYISMFGIISSLWPGNRIYASWLLLMLRKINKEIVVITNVHCANTVYQEIS